MKMKVAVTVVLCFVAVGIIFGGYTSKAQQEEQIEQNCANGEYRWDLSYCDDFDIAREAVGNVAQTPDVRFREADIRVSRCSFFGIGEELESEISNGMNFQLNMLFPNEYFQDRERDIVAHVHYPAEVKAGEEAVISIHLKDSDGTVYAGEWKFVASEDLWLTPGFMDYGDAIFNDDIFWEDHRLSVMPCRRASHKTWKDDLPEEEGEWRSDMAIFEFYASADEIDTPTYEKGCRYGGGATLVHAFYRH